MRATEHLERYRLLDLVSEDAGPDGLVVTLWHAYDETLDRGVAIRVLGADDPRAAAVLGAAQAAAGVDDRRLLRVLDILTLPATDADPARVGVVSEWATGRNLERTIEDRGGRPFAPADALWLVGEVARALAAAGQFGVVHGRLRPSAVFITDAGEVRVRGLAVDAALFGPLADSSGDATRLTPEAVDVDALGSLVYLLTTGTWPGVDVLAEPSSPRAAGVLLPPSQVRAGVPRTIDDIVARSVTAASRPKGVPRVGDAGSFAAMAGAGLDTVAPIVTPTPRRAVRTTVTLLGRLIAVLVATALVVGIAWVGFQLLTGEGTTRPAPTTTEEDILTASARPLEDTAVAGIEQTFPIVAYRSYDPFGDDDGNERPDRRKGRENEEGALTVNDDDPETAWLTDEYGTPTLDGKPGVGLIVDLGEPRDVQEVTLNLVGRGSSVEVLVSDAVRRDPSLWSPLASASGASSRITVRSPRPVTGRYVLVWFTRVPPAEVTGLYQGGVRSIVVRG